MLDLEVVQVFLDSLGYEISAIIRDERVWNLVPGDDIVPDEFFRRHGSDSFVGGCYHPLGEVVDRHEDKAVTIGGCKMDRSNDVYPPGREGLWR